jgi:hypothetical protein
MRNCWSVVVASDCTKLTMDETEVQSWLPFKVESDRILCVEGNPTPYGVKGAGSGIREQHPKGLPTIEECAFRTAIDIGLNCPEPAPVDGGLLQLHFDHHHPSVSGVLYL